MGSLRYSEAAISRSDLARGDCLRELCLWLGCETVEGFAVDVGETGKFTVHVAGYGSAYMNKANRALRYIRREKAQRFRLKTY
jgi:hypothetical protein